MISTWIHLSYVEENMVQTKHYHDYDQEKVATRKPTTCPTVEKDAPMVSLSMVEDPHSIIW